LNRLYSAKYRKTKKIHTHQFVNTLASCPATHLFHFQHFYFKANSTIPIRWLSPASPSCLP